MSWWRQQHLDRPISDPDGTVWHFLVWAGQIGSVFSERIYFWNEGKTETGLIDLGEGQTLDIPRIRDVLKRLANNPEYRSRFHQPLKFPIERTWPPAGV